MSQSQRINHGCLLSLLQMTRDLESPAPDSVSQVTQQLNLRP